MIGTLIVEGGLVLAAGLAGRIEGYHQGTKVKNITSLFAYPEKSPNSVWCICGHAKNFHVKGNRDCRAHTGKEDQYGREIICKCVLFMLAPDREPDAPKGPLDL